VSSLRVHALALPHLYLAPTIFPDDAERHAVIRLLPFTPRLKVFVLESLQQFFPVVGYE
jgi:hypothetical protein